MIPFGDELAPRGGGGASGRKIDRVERARRDSFRAGDTQAPVVCPSRADRLGLSGLAIDSI
jgi:hypothetical protein